MSEPSKDGGAGPQVGDYFVYSSSLGWYCAGPVTRCTQSSAYVSKAGLRQIKRDDQLIAAARESDQ